MWRRAGRLLDPDLEELELVVDNDGARSSGYLVNLDMQDVADIAVTADGDWNVNFFDPEINADQWDGTEILDNAGPDVVRFTGEATTVVFRTAREEPFAISTYDAETGLETLVEGLGPADADVELPAGPVSVVIDAAGNWSLDPAPGG